MITIYSSDSMGVRGNCLYLYRHEVMDAAGLREAVKHDYVCAEYKNSYRSGGNFITSNCLGMDCDNDHTDHEHEWITPDDVRRNFPDVPLAIHFSRHHMKPKDQKSARPRFHCLFAIEPTTDVKAVFLQMGLGKSVITLTAIQDLALERFEISRVLVIAPLRVARDTWPDEIQKWDHLHELTYSVAVGTEAERRTALRQNTLVHIINRENVQWLVEQSGLPFDYDMIVIDELSSFKSYQAKRFRALMKVRPKVKRIVGLTGTPSSNGLMDLWAEFRLLDMGKRLGRFITKYREVFFLPDRRSAQQVFSWKHRPGAEDEIYELISDITISMKSVDFLQMPECISNRVPVRLSRSERDTYDELKRELVTSLRGEQIDAVNAASLSNKLCQMANGGIYVDRPSTADAVAGYSPCGTSSTCPRGLVGAEAPPSTERRALFFHERKLDALEDIIEAANGRPVLVAYWFKHDFARIRECFSVREIRTSADIADWNAGRIPVACIHPASAGHGLNLQAGGNTLVWFGLTWSLELYQQTNARLWRQGQQADTVVIHHIVCENTIDEQMRCCKKPSFVTI